MLFIIDGIIYLQIPNVTCHDVYSIDLLSSNFSSFRVGPLIPVMMAPNMLELTLPAVLEGNTVYNATVLAININGETASNTHLILSKFLSVSF